MKTKTPQGGPETKAELEGPELIKTHVEHHPVTLTDTEMLALGKELARERAEVDAAEVRKAAIVDTCKAEIALHVKNASALQQKLNQGWELREVEVDEIHNFPEKRVTFVRKDTGVVVRERPMSALERDRKLPFPNDETPGTEGGTAPEVAP